MPEQVAKNQWIPTTVSIVVGVAVWFMFELVINNFGLVGGFSYWWAGYTAMFLASAFLGYFFCQRPWRWGVYIVIAHALFASIRSKGDHNMLPFELIFFALLAIVFVFASYFGAWLFRKTHERHQ
jgi:hypothetical protein